MSRRVRLVPKRRFYHRASVAAAAAVVVAATAITPSVAGGATSRPAAAQPTITSQLVGNVGGQPVKEFTLANTHGMVVRIFDYGGIIQSIRFPGTTTDVTLGYPTLQDYVKYESSAFPAKLTGQGTFFGALIGRYANRIDKGKFSLDGKTYQVPVNNNGNALHGGTIGFNQHVWTPSVVAAADGSVGLRLTYVSPAGQMGFPGTLTTIATYRLSNANTLSLNFHATTTADTVVNLTNHTYWNLGGEASGTVYNQRLRLNANKFTPVAKDQIPTGQIVPVAGTPFDFRNFTAIGQNINQDNNQLFIGEGYDLNWVLNQTTPRSLVQAAQVFDPANGHQLTVWTTQPGIQFYSGNFLTGVEVGTSHHLYRQGDGFALETQHFPDSPNQPQFPTTELKPGHTYDQTTVWLLSQHTS